MIRMTELYHNINKEFKDKYKFIIYHVTLDGTIPTFYVNMKSVAISNIMEGYDRNHILDEICDDLLALFDGGRVTARYGWFL